MVPSTSVRKTRLAGDLSMLMVANETRVYCYESRFTLRCAASRTLCPSLASTHDVETRTTMELLS